MPTSHLNAASSEDARLAQLRSWLRTVLGARDFGIAPASADASFRRYFRVTLGAESWIAMDAPPDKEDLTPYVRVAAMLAEAGVNAPRITHCDPEQGFLLNTDMGSRTYLSALHSGADADGLYQDAIDALIRFQVHDSVSVRRLPPYDEDLLRRELALFPEWFCRGRLGLELTSADDAALERVFDFLCAEALKQPKVFVHRDYHSRNLMVCDDARYGANPGILDFQDAVYGPITYDLVSLLRDCYVAWPVERVHGWVAEFRVRAQRVGLSVGNDEREFLRAFDLMGVQRHLKAIGIFARLWRRDGKPGYLQDIPRTLGYVRAVCDGYPELGALCSLIDRRIQPLLANTPAAETG